MLLVIDVGNTNIVLGVFRGGDLAYQWRLSSERTQTADELRMAVRSLLDEAELAVSDIDGVAIASVVPSLNRPLAKSFEALLPSAKIGFLNSETSPIELAVEAPSRVGADRIANCIGAYALHGGPILVLDFGTATTFDLVSEEGSFLGGAIAPEMRLAARALTERAAQLHAVELKIPGSVIGKNTETNIQAGVVLGYFSLVDGLISRFRSEVSADLKVMATGGKGQLFYENLPSIQHYDDVLTLKGLRLWWEPYSRQLS